MTPVAQRTEHDCIRACVAAITGLDVPDFTASPFQHKLRVFGDTQDWLWANGWSLLDDTGERPMPGYSLAIGASPRIPDANHATVALDGVVIWDPSPHRDDPGRVFTPSGYWPVRQEEP